MSLRKIFSKKKKGDAQSTDPAVVPRSSSRPGIKSYDPRILWRTKSDDRTPVPDTPIKLSSYNIDPTAAYENQPNLKSTVKASVGPTADVFTPLKYVARGLAAVLKDYDQTIANRETIRSLILRVEGLAEPLREPAPEGEIKEINRRQKLAEKLEKALRDLWPLVDRGKITESLNYVKDGELLTSLAQDIRDAMMDYQTALQQDIHHKNRQLIDAMGLTRLNGMRRTENAGYLCGNRVGCLKGTRTEVLLQIEQWLVSEEDHRIFWLSGLAGTGKSTIAQTFAEVSFADGKLGASFFCSRDSEDRSDIGAIFPTLAFQLAHRYSRFRQQLLQVLETSPDVGRESLSSQLEKVIIRPFTATKIPTLIIIDALDECKDREPASAILSVLSRHVHEIPEVKFLITGRPEPPIREGFRLAPLRPITEVLKLHDVRRSSVDEDITLYLRILLTDIHKTRGDCEFPEEWPSTYDINILCKKAGGLFIYASTVVRFVASEHHLPTERLDLIILGPRSAAHEGGIDVLYTQILQLAFQSANSGEEELYSRFRNVVGAVLLVFYPLSKKTLSNLLRHYGTPSHISTTLRFLHSLLNVPDNENEPIRVFHKSFSDFLTDRTRCKDNRFFINPAVHHEDILFSCLELMKKRLKRNICDLDDYTVLNEVNDLSARKEEYIGSSLEYACRFWTRHLGSVPGDGSSTQRVQEAVEEFFSKHLLCWIEVLSIVGHLGGAVYAINYIRKWYTTAGISTCEQADDSERLILEHFDAICNSPSQIYHSALPLSPSSSWIRKFYEAEAAREVRVLVGLPDQWDTCSRTFHLDGHPTAFAHSGDIMTVGLGSDIVFLDVVTGSRTSVLRGHSGTITTLALSLDGTSLVSSSDDRSVNLWDIQTGGIVETLNDIPDISATSISPNNTTIALGTRDGTIRFWDVRTGKCRFVNGSHGDEVTAIAFSPTNSQHLISSSRDRIVGQWDVDSLQGGAFHHGADPVRDITYASDGTHFISCTKRVATIRDSESGVVVAELVAPDDQYLDRCCFAPDGKFVACSGSTTIFVWAITNSGVRLIRHLVGHSEPITFITFPSSLVSVSYDQTVKFWPIDGLLKDSITTNNIAALHGSTTLASVKLFPDHNTIVTADNTGEVKTWDLITGRFKSSFSTPANGYLDTHLAGDTLIIVWFDYDEEKYHVWDVCKRQLLRKADNSFGTVVYDLKISGDGSKMFGLSQRGVEAVSMETGEGAGRVKFQRGESLFVCGSKVGINPERSMGWDFGRLKVPDGREPLDRFRLDLVNHTTVALWSRPRWIEDIVTGSRVFQLPDRYFDGLLHFTWDGRYLLIWSSSGEIVIIDFDCVSPQ